MIASLKFDPHCLHASRGTQEKSCVEFAQTCAKRVRFSLAFFTPFRKSPRFGVLRAFVRLDETRLFFFDTNSPGPSERVEKSTQSFGVIELETPNDSLYPLEQSPRTSYPPQKSISYLKNHPPTSPQKVRKTTGK